jgi:hypothetical protein
VDGWILVSSGSVSAVSDGICVLYSVLGQLLMTLLL